MRRDRLWAAGVTHKLYSENEILGVLAQVDAGTAVGDVARVSVASKATIHHWQARYGGMITDDGSGNLTSVG